MLKERVTTVNNNLDDYINENNIIAQDFLQRYFYNEWYYKNKTSKSIELIISPECNLGCKYCYWFKYKNSLYPPECFDVEKVKQNLLLILKWLDHNQYNPILDLFTGELFAQQIGFDCLDIIYEYEKTVNPLWRIEALELPTNFSFCVDDALVEKVKQYKEKFEEINIEFWFSASFDGKYEEPNRPYVHDLDFKLKCERNDEFYDKIFQAVVDLNSGLHPMVYAEGIEKWKDNFLWFQEMMEKFDIPWEEIYLLEVRNDNWNTQNINEFCKFVEFLFDWVYEKVGHDKEKFSDFIITHGFNLCGSAVTRLGRGLTCSIQAELCIRLGDLAVYPCHRTGYEHLHYGKYVPTSDDNILEFKCENVELLLTIYSIHRKNFNYCAQCPMNHLCIGQCLGACYETNKNIFTPIPTVCALEHAKTATMIKIFIKYGIYQDIYNILSQPQKKQFEWLRKEIMEQHD